MAYNASLGDGNLSFSVPEADSSTFTVTAAGLQDQDADPLDLSNLADFEDEASLVNDLLASSELVSASEGAPAGAGLGIGGAGGGSSSSSSNTARDPSAPLSLLELDVKLARLLGVLEHACQDTAASVERSIEEVARTVPRLTFDLQLMRENVVLLRFTLESIRKRSQEATSSSAETSSVMRRLKVLDTIKTRMEEARDVLREAEAWSSLESEVTALVQEHSYAKAAERLAEANKSMVVFQNSPEYEQRRSLMLSLQNGLEAGLSASLVSAINKRDMDSCKTYYAIFGQIQRETEFRHYYFGSRRAGLVKDWQEARLADCQAAGGSGGDGASGSSSAPSDKKPLQPFSSYIPTFYKSLSTLIKDERSYIPSIFPDPLDTLSMFLQTTLDALQPTFPQRISDLSTAHGPRLLLELIRIYQATEDFAMTVDRSFSQLQATLSPPVSARTAGLPSPAPSTPGPASGSAVSPGGTPGPAVVSGAGTPQASALKRVQQQQQRRQSKAMSMSISRRQSRPSVSAGIPEEGRRASTGPDGLPAEPLRAWETTLFEPFLDWQAEYSELESRLLKAELGKVTQGQDAMAFLLTSVTANDEHMGSNGTGGRGGGDEEYEDDEARTGRSRAQGAAKILLDQTSAVFALAEEALGRCMALTHGYGASGYVEAVDDTFRTFLLKERDTLLRAKETRTRNRRRTHMSDADMTVEYSSDDWSTVQLALRLLEACRTIYSKIAGLEAKICSRLVDVARLVTRDARVDPMNQVVAGVPRGALALLWQSTLNSAALTSLLESIQERAGPASVLHPDSSKPQPLPLLHNARAAGLDLTRASQLFLHDTTIAPLRALLDSYSTLAAWSQTSDARQDSRGAFDLHIPTFSLSPSETITKVGEGLFNLPGMFEAYADDDALGFSLETLPELDAETIRMLRTEYGQAPLLPGAAGIVASPIPSPGLYQHAPSPHVNKHGHAPRMSLAGGSGGNEFLPAGSGSTSAVSPAPAGAPRISPSLSHHHSYSLSHHPPSSGAAHAYAGPQMQAQPLPAEVVISTWLSSLTRSVLLHLVQKAVPAIRSLTKHGQEQLAADLGYISNVAKALDVEVEQLEKWRIALEAEAGSRNKLSAPGTGEALNGSESRLEEDGTVQEVDPEVAEMLQRIRSRPLLQASVPR